MNEHEKNELILRQRQEIERLVMENAELKRKLEGKGDKFTFKRAKSSKE